MSRALPRQPRLPRRHRFLRLALANALALPHVVAFANVVAACLPVKAQAATLGLPAIQPVLGQLDELFAKADAAAYLAQFEPDHPGAHAQLRQQLLSSFAPGVPLQRTSTLLGKPRQFGARTVVRVHFEVRAADGRSDALYAHDAMLAFRSAAGDPTARPVPTFCVEVPAEFGSLPNDLFRCPACNYELGGVAGWLCVPQRNDRAQALEAASFYLIGTDIACDLSVRIEDPLPSTGQVSGAGETPAGQPLAVVERLAAALRRLDPTVRPGIAVPWLPENHRAAATATTAPATTPGAAGIAGAQLAVDLPADRANPDGSRAVFHVVTLGALQHLMLVRGGQRSLQEHAPAVAALLNSYRMLDVDCDRALAAARPLAHHTGGELAGTTYRNTQWNVAVEGPNGWQPGLRSGGNLFRVVWTSPQGSRLWLLGYATPEGMTKWCRETADLWFREMCAEKGLTIVASTDATSTWKQDQGCSADSRLVTCTAPIRVPVLQSAPGGSVAAQQRLFRLVVRDDMFLVLDGQARSDDEWAPLRAAMASLRLP